MQTLQLWGRPENLHDMMPVAIVCHNDLDIILIEMMTGLFCLYMSSRELREKFGPHMVEPIFSFEDREEATKMFLSVCCEVYEIQPDNLQDRLDLIKKMRNASKIEGTA